MNKLKFKNLHTVLVEYLTRNNPDFDVRLLDEGSYITVHPSEQTIEIHVSPNHPEHYRIYPSSIKINYINQLADIRTYLTSVGMNLTNPTEDLLNEYYEFLITLFDESMVNENPDGLQLSLPFNSQTIHSTVIQNLKSESALRLFLEVYSGLRVLDINFAVGKSKLEEMLEAYTKAIPTGNNNRLDITHDDVFVKLK